LSAPDRRHVVVLGAQPEYLTGLRGPMIRALLNRGHGVTAIGSEEMPKVRAALESWGARYEVVPIRRAGLNPALDLRALYTLVKVLRRLKPDLLFAYTVKPIVYGLPAAWLAGVERRYAMIAGRGFAFLPGLEMRRRVTRHLATNLYRLGLRFADGVLFQNEDDRRLFLSTGMLRPGCRQLRIQGSGVDLVQFPPAPLPPGPVTFLMISRLLIDKGVREYVEAAARLKKAWPTARFLLVGASDPSPNGVPEETISAWKRRGDVEFLGALPDVTAILAACHVYVLPSYGEGLPRSVLEAMATGRPIVTTDAPGCRDTVVPEVNGYLTPVRDSAALAAAMMRFLDQPERIEPMGQASLKIARDRFDVDLVNGTIIEFLSL
jgi:glycosyltransferase involved in cell wall biosynthesis